MNRRLALAVGQLGPIARSESRTSVVRRLVELLRQAKARGCRLVVFPEMALTTFFPRWHIEDEAELDSFFEREMPGPETKPLFEEAARLGIGFYLGYCELVMAGNRKRRFNTSILMGADGKLVGKYRKIHVPGSDENNPDLPFQHLEQLYFESGDLGFPVWDVRCRGSACASATTGAGPRPIGSWRCRARRSCCWATTPLPSFRDWPEQNELRAFHHLVCMQAAAYQNGIWIAAAGKSGREEGVEMLAHSCIIAPSGQVVALTQGRGDELIQTDCDIEASQEYKRFHDFARNRKPGHYKLIAMTEAELDKLRSRPPA